MSHVIPYLGGTLRPTFHWTWARPPSGWEWRWVFRRGRWEVEWRPAPLQPFYAYTQIPALTNLTSPTRAVN